jgi:hypothetical protein
MLISKLRTGPLWGLGGFILGVVLSATAVGALGLSASTSTLPSPDKSKTNVLREVASSIQQSIVLPIVKVDEIDAAIKDFPLYNQSQVREDVTNGKYRLLWLTAWDWDTAEGEPGNTISILSDTQRQIVTLNSHRARIAIREPKSGNIGLRGEFTEDGNIAISVLSGTQPIALPRMSPGQAVTIEINAQAVVAGRSSINIPAKIPSLPED